jgi:hypothetical protein
MLLSPFLPTRPPGVPLEVVVEVIVVTASPGPSARDQVSRDERNAPSLDLAYMSLFVVSARVETMGITADDHVAQSHRREAPVVGKPS